MKRTKLRIKSHYGVAPDVVLNLKQLSLKGKGLYTYLQSKPDGWRFSIARIALQSKDGKSSIREGIAELEAFGLLSRSPLKNEEGKWDGYDYLLSEKPLSDFPTTDNPTTDFKYTLSKTEVSKTEYSKTEEDTPKPPEGDSGISKKNTIQEVVDHFFSLKGWDYKGEHKAVYKRFLRSAKELLGLCDGDVPEANHCITKISEWADSRDLDWSIETVFKKWYDIDKLKPKEKKSYYKGNRLFKIAGKKYVLMPNGEKMEFAGRESEIEWK